MDNVNNNIGRPFRLIGVTTEFTVVAEFLSAGAFPAVVGHTSDGLQTVAGIDDIIFLDEETP